VRARRAGGGAAPLLTGRAPVAEAGVKDVAGGHQLVPVLAPRGTCAMVACSTSGSRAPDSRVGVRSCVSRPSRWLVRTTAARLHFPLSTSRRG
jgi:hypothetical protein